MNTKALSPVSIQIKQRDCSYHKPSPLQHTHQYNTMSVIYFHGPWCARKACNWATVCRDTGLILVLCKSLCTIPGSKYTYPCFQSYSFVQQKTSIVVLSHSPITCRTPCGSLEKSAYSDLRQQQMPGRCSWMVAIQSQPRPAQFCFSASL